MFADLGDGDVESCRGKSILVAEFLYSNSLAQQGENGQNSRDSKKYLRQWQFVSKVQLTFYCRGKSILVAEFLYSNSLAQRRENGQKKWQRFEKVP